MGDAKYIIELLVAIVMLGSAAANIFSNKALKEWMKSALKAQEKSQEDFRSETRRELETIKEDLKEMAKEYVRKEDYRDWVLAFEGQITKADDKAEAVHTRLDTLLKKNKIDPRD